MDLLEEIYNRSPIVLQNVMISTYGLLLKRERYGKEYTRILESLRESDLYSSEQVNQLQKERLSCLIRYAFNHVPYYRETWKRIGLIPSDITLDNLGQVLPLISKEDIRENHNSFKSELIKNHEIIKITTSGTTGKPLTIYTSKYVRQANYAFMTRFLNWEGIKYNEKSATFAGRAFIPPSQKSPPFWRANWLNRNYLFSSFHITRNNIPSYIEALERIQPTYIDSYPSAIAAIAKYLVENDIKIDIHLKAIITSSETLYQEQRNLIEKAFRTKVVDQYGSAEMVAFIGQCEQGNYHVNPEYGIVELVDANGKNVDIGQTGQLIATGFLNYVMPMIRYQIGDSAVFSRETCCCGRNFPVIQELVGRQDEQIKTRDGRSISRLGSIFKGLSSIREAQIIQTDIDNIIIKIVKMPGYKEWMQKELVEELKKRVGQDISITCDYVENIPKSSSGKMRAVISHVG